MPTSRRRRATRIAFISRIPNKPPIQRPEDFGPEASRVLFLENNPPSKATPLLPPLNGWIKYTHICGSRYFYNSKHRIITSSDIEADDRIRKNVIKVRREFLELLEEEDILHPEDVARLDMVVQLGDTDEEDKMFFLDHVRMQYLAVTDEG